MTPKLPVPSRDRIPFLSKIEEPSTRERLMPVAIGVGLLATGALLWRIKPSALQIPEPAPLHDDSGRSTWRRAARKSRDGVARVAPDNLSDSVGRSLVFAGAALLVTRMLDEVTSRR
ncbi:hypothetical protein [Pseudooceanicola sp. LIPI14-2-Ac024]|uniref:hypothetical protein n=1 Tax=Pseudooceanicola sp. LIPI14-2-Ac024 TaxID=3344875 RepID=UPI0035D10D28